MNLANALLKHKNILREKGWAGEFLNYSDELENYAGKSNAVPFAGYVSPNRLLMYAAQTKQRITLAQGERPYIASNLRNDIQRSSFNNVANEDIKVLHTVKKKIRGKETGTCLIIYQDLNDGMVHIIENEEFTPTNRGYGVRNINRTNDKKDVKKGEYITHTHGYDEDGSFIGEGLNFYSSSLLGAITIEDAFLITKSAAKRFSHYEVDTIELELDSSNDWLRNLYGGEGYQPFPLPGEAVREDGIAVALSKQITKTRYIKVSDTPTFADRRYFYPKGIVYDIDILAPMGTRINNTFVAELFEDSCNYIQEKRDALSSIVEQTDNYSLQLGDMYQDLIAICDHGFGYRNGVVTVPMNKAIIRIKCYAIKEMQVGDKMSGLYGNKGVIGRVIDDADAYRDKYGRVIEVMFNPLANPNRAIGAPMICSSLTSLADSVRNFVFNIYGDGDDKMSNKEKVKFILDFLNGMSECDHKYYSELVSKFGIDDWLEFLHDIPIHWQVNPYTSHMEPALFYAMVKALRELGVTCGKMEVYDKDGYMIGKGNTGWQYIQRLEQTASKKLSLRTYGSTDSTGSFAKTDKKKNHLTMHADTPVKYSEYVNDIINNSLEERHLDVIIYRDDALKALQAWSPLIGIEFTHFEKADVE